MVAGGCGRLCFGLLRKRHKVLLFFFSFFRVVFLFIFLGALIMFFRALCYF